jgi:glycosyltransferase involved in cell wall biosynthesis
MTLIRPWIRKTYGGYNTYIRMLERMQGKVRRPVRLCVTWTAYWWSFEFLKRRPFFVTVHGKEIGHRSSGVWRWMQEHVYRRAEGIIAISRYTANELRAQFPEVDAVKIEVIHHGLPIMAFPPKSEHGGPVRILSIGQWIDRKGFDLLIGSVRRLSETSAVSLDIVTDDQAPAIADPNIRIHRNADEVTKRQLLADADVFVLANRHIGSDFEGFGYVVLEAMQAGCPCVVGRNGGPAEIIRDGQDGFVIDPEQLDDLDRAIRTLVEEPRLRERMGASAKARSQSEFSEESVQNALNAYLST